MPEHGYTRSSPFEPDGSGELKSGNTVSMGIFSDAQGYLTPPSVVRSASPIL